ncbi:hypothetical protein VB780_25975 [Leptolyngbya sp. CCNP1308]|uniref:hypothetical protein n=1 Tax=Leptolyngbya sp. CCNP1308 TaxID=3110255 RepID=UPI002B1F53A1|nr:hypothetical protein [Leptolyngbya sp. CCNP1308]MEA5452049.1 hypothetical protein [Leptolyngbya sp. CCNP1308]
MQSKKLLTEANARLKAGNIKVSIILKRNTLYLQTTLPPKPTSTKAKPHQQQVNLGGVYLNAAGLKRAEAEALRLRNELTMERFDWANWSRSQVDPLGERTIADWVAAFEVDYFNRRERNPASETTWEKDYLMPFRRLPQQQLISAAILIQTAQLYPPDTRCRQRACNAYGRLAKFAGVDVAIAEYRGRYSSGAVNPRDLPSDEAIIQTIEGMDNPAWRFAIALMATYGLRDHEIFHVDLQALQEPPGVCTVLEGKTGWRQVWPCRREWWELYCKGHFKRPNLTARRNSDYGVKVAQFFNRRKLPMLPYDLRHAWAARTAVFGLDPAIAAKMMGHDLSVHTRIYHQFLNQSILQAAWERSQR